MANKCSSCSTQMVTLCIEGGLYRFISELLMELSLPIFLLSVLSTLSEKDTKRKQGHNIDCTNKHFCHPPKCLKTCYVSL